MNRIMCDLNRSTLDITTVDALMRNSLMVDYQQNITLLWLLPDGLALGKGQSGQLSWINLIINFLLYNETIRTMEYLNLLQLNN